MSDRRMLRRMAGLLYARLPELKLERVSDPRRLAARWELRQVLRAVLVALMAGCRSLADMETLTERLSVGSRRLLELPRRLPDTTARDIICRLEPDELRACLHRLVRSAHRRKALGTSLPFQVVAMDGKVTALPSWDDELVQRHTPEEGVPYGLMRTVSCALVSAAGKPCLDAMPIPARTNEMGFFQDAFAALCATYGDLFEVVTYDAGVSSEANGRAVVEAGKHYVFRLKNEARYMYRMAEELCDADDVVAESEDVLDNHTAVTRRLVIVAVERHWAYGRNAANELKTPEDSIWEHTKTFLRVESIKRRDGVVVERDVRFWNTSLAHDALTPEQWLELVRLHWAVENNNHHTLDTAFAEDDRPWITGDARGTLAVLVLRRIAYTLLTLFRSVTQRSQERRGMRWKVLLSWVRDTLVGATQSEVARLRPRKAAAVSG